MPFIKDIFSRISEIENLSLKDCSIFTFRKIMKQMGFNKQNVRDISRRILMEKSENVVKRREYLKKVGIGN